MLIALPQASWWGSGGHPGQWSHSILILARSTNLEKKAGGLFSLWFYRGCSTHSGLPSFGWHCVAFLSVRQHARLAPSQKAAIRALFGCGGLRPPPVPAQNCRACCVVYPVCRHWLPNRRPYVSICWYRRKNGPRFCRNGLGQRWLAFMRLCVLLKNGGVCNQRRPALRTPRAAGLFLGPAIPSSRLFERVRIGVDAAVRGFPQNKLVASCLGVEAGHHTGVGDPRPRCCGQADQLESTPSSTAGRCRPQRRPAQGTIIDVSMRHRFQGA